MAATPGTKHRALPYKEEMVISAPLLNRGAGSDRASSSIDALFAAMLPVSTFVSFFKAARFRSQNLRATSEHFALYGVTIATTSFFLSERLLLHRMRCGQRLPKNDNCNILFSRALVQLAAISPEEAKHFDYDKVREWPAEELSKRKVEDDVIAKTLSALWHIPLHHDPVSAADLAKQR
ncbi:MAG: hypothetical protein GY822_19575 [Deltaproteobacteria bacterium]|nr:hypothetical protein [Deltaproteobacteria bacterium]